MIDLIVALVLLQSALIAAVFLLWRRSRRIEEALAESEERIALATLPRNVGLWRWDAQTNEFWATDHCRDILQVGAGMPLNRFSVLSGIHPDDRSRFTEVLMRPGSGEVIDFEFRVVRVGGEVRWVTGKARAKRDALGRILRVTGLVIDVTDRKQAEAESQSQRQQLEHLTRMAIMGELSGALAHELTQPLTAILSNAQAAQRFLANDRVDLSEVRDILQDIVDDDKRAGEVIGWVRALLKREAVQLEPLDMPELVREALIVTHSDLLGKGVDVGCRFAEDLPPVTGDRVQIQQVLLNLILNAAEAMAGNRPRDRRIEIRVAPVDGELEVSVADCGTGISREQLERIFEAFYTTKKNGLGLGLAICRSIIAVHGGRLWATSDGRRGATFHFTLPEAAGAGAARDAATRTDHETLSASQYRKPNPSRRPLC